MWHNVFFGWLGKVLVLKYGGPRLYAKVKYLVLGMILGEVMAVIGWNVFAAIRGYLGLTYQVCDILPK
jgi:hypothetical protein